MNQLINHIKEIDEQIKKVKRILENGEFAAAGLEISLSVGPRSQYEDFTPRADRNTVDGIQLGIPSNPDSLLNLILEGLIASRRFNQSNLTREVEMARLFLETTPHP